MFMCTQAKTYPNVPALCLKGHTMQHSGNMSQNFQNCKNNRNITNQGN